MGDAGNSIFHFSFQISHLPFEAPPVAATIGSQRLCSGNEK
jgi:hypothetical protein